MIFILNGLDYLCVGPMMEFPTCVTGVVCISCNRGSGLIVHGRVGSKNQHVSDAKQAVDDKSLDFAEFCRKMKGGWIRLNTSHNP